MKRTNNFLVIALAASLLFQACANQESGSFEAVNRQAAQEYLEPIRPAYEGRNPAWNGFARKFLYAPSFDFPKMDGAVSYKFTIKDTRSEATWSFEADSPDANLSPVWNDIHPADVHLTVEAIGADGKVLGTVGERDFLRDFPFQGPYPGKAMPYRESALRAALYTHRMPAEPDCT